MKMKTTLENLFTAPLILLAAACGTATTPSSDCGDAESFRANGNTYCVASKAIIEKGFECPVGMYDHAFDEATVCSPDEDIPVEDRDALYEYTREQEEEGCAGPNPSVQECAADADCAAGETCSLYDSGGCAPESCVCDPLANEWSCTEGCVRTYECVPIPTCAADADCPDSRQTCEDGLCVIVDTHCQVNAQCPSGQICQQASCYEGTPTSCEHTSDCWTDEYCSEGICEPAFVFCNTDGSCPNGGVCEDSRCGFVDEALICEADVDCSPGWTCVDGACTLP